MRTPPNNLRRIWKLISVAGFILGIISSIISILAYVKIDNIEELARQAREWRIAISLSQPQERSEISGNAVPIAGKAEFRVTAAQVDAVPMVNLILEQNKVELVPFVRPISDAKWWWVQASPAVRQDGSFDGVIQIGDKGLEYQVIILAVQKGTVAEGDKLINLPFSYAASNTATVKRIQ